MKKVVPLTKAIETSLYGSKAVGLGEAARHGLPVPPGVALSGDLVEAISSGAKPESGWRVGTEHEKFSFYLADRSPVPYEGARGIRALLEGRYAVAIDDIRHVAPPALRHRLILNFEGEAEGVKADTIIAEILKATKEA